MSEERWVTVPERSLCFLLGHYLSCRVEHGSPMDERTVLCILMLGYHTFALYLWPESPPPD